MVLKNVRCRITGHRPQRRSITWDTASGYFTAPCRTCGQSLRRHASKDWRPVQDQPADS